MKNIEVNINRNYFFNANNSDSIDCANKKEQYVQDILNYIGINIIDIKKNEEVLIKVYVIPTYQGDVDNIFKDFVFKHVNYEYKYLNNFLYNLNSNKIQIEKQLFKDNILFIDEFKGSRSISFYLQIIEELLIKILKSNFTVSFNKLTVNIKDSDIKFLDNSRYKKNNGYYIKSY